MWGKAMEASQITVNASEKEVREALVSALSPEEFDTFGISEHERPHDPFEADQRGEAVSFMTVLVWLSQAAAGGMAYDIMRKASAVLVERFGKDRVVVKQPSDD
ncbi:hypothetical protein MCEMIE4_00081 [Sphingobium cupriresistens]